ncbi:cupredoxin domain-containing protein [Collimonas silvisoli]|uniref:cupredoxin domain-containing protein n=1 Tax=Collimonas silvisoli TaxID=2825884 RepID=UPI001E2C980E|nr:cupredoxin family copper-binding protein [Collimonas silvisoli]
MRMPAFSSRAGWQWQAIASALLLCVSAGAALEADAGTQPVRHAVVIEAMKFSPEVIEAKAGDTIVWTNKDAFPHTVTAENHSFDSKGIASDGSWKFKATAKGVFPYVCSFHPTMKGKLVVK